jgi:hypothetical protein
MGGGAFLASAYFAIEHIEPGERESPTQGGGFRHRKPLGGGSIRRFGE